MNNIFSQLKTNLIQQKESNLDILLSVTLEYRVKWVWCYLEGGEVAFLLKNHFVTQKAREQLTFYLYFIEFHIELYIVNSAEKIVTMILFHNWSCSGTEKTSLRHHKKNKRWSNLNINIKSQFTF